MHDGREPSQTNSERPKPGAEQLYAAFIERRSRGEPVDFDEFCAAHREHETALRVIHLARFEGEEDETGSFEAVLRSKLVDVAAPEPPLRGNGRRYAVRREVARGGMGVIYEVWDEDFERPLAMKVIRTQDSIGRFLNEARITGRLDHPGVVPVHELGVDARGRAFFTMPLVEGDELETIFRNARSRQDGWTRERALEVLLRVCDTLAYAHSRHVIHRDLKPANIMVGRFGQTYVMDWGLAKAAGVEGATAAEVVARDADDPAARTPEDPALVTRAGTVLGTPAYMPPEQAAGDLDALDERSDVYSVGAMLYTLLTGSRPYAEAGTRKSSREIVEAVIKGPPGPIHVLDRDAPPELVAVCEKAMARAKESRYASMRELRDEIHAYLEHRVVGAYRTGPVAEFKMWIVRNRGLATAIGAAFVLFVIGLGVFILTQEVARTKLARESGAKSKALVEKSVALEQEQQAVRRAEGLRLAAQSAGTLDTDPGLALLIAIEGAQRAPGLLANNALYGALAAIREERTLEGHSSVVHAAVFDPTGDRVASASQDGTVRIWSATTGDELLRMRGHGSACNTVDFSPDGRKVLSSNFDLTARVWDAGTGEQLLVLEGHRDVVDFACFSPDGARIVTVCRDRRVRIFDAGSGALLMTFSTHEAGVYHASFSPDASRVVSAAHDRTARVFDLATGAEALVLGHDSVVNSARFSPDGRLLLTASTDGTARLWDAANGAQLTVYDGHEGAVLSAVFSADGRTVLTASSDGTARLWNASSGAENRILRGHEGRVVSAVFAPGEQRVLTASWDRTARVWDPVSGREVSRLRGHTARVASARFSADGSKVVTASWDRTVRVWRAVTDREARVDPRSVAQRIVISPDGGRFLSHAEGTTVEVSDTATNEVVATLRGHAAAVTMAEFSPGGEQVVTASSDGTARIWDLRHGSSVVLEGHRRGVEFASFSPDGKWVATASRDFEARVWDAADGALVATIEIAGAWWCLAAIFSPDGKRLATVSEGGTTRIWDIGAVSSGARPEILHTLRHSEWLHAAAFSEDGSLLLVAANDDTMTLWDAATGERLAVLRGHDGALRAASFSPDLRHVATLHGGGAAHLWELPSGAEFARVQTETGEFVSIGFEPDEAAFRTVSANRIARSWPLDPLPAALARAPRELTHPERQRLGVGTEEQQNEHRRRRNLDRTERDLAMAEKAWTAAPAHRAAHFGHASDVAWSAWTLFEPPAFDRREVLDTMKKAMGIIERATFLPEAPSSLRLNARNLRARLSPYLPTYATVDAALNRFVELLPEGAEWRFSRGTKEPSPGLEWTTGEFDDRDWESGPSGFGYGDGDDRTFLGDMQSSYSTVYVRRLLHLDGLDRWRAVKLAVKADDGFIAYVNSFEVGRAGATPAGKRAAVDTLASSVEAEPLEWEIIAIDKTLLREGDNIIALQGLNHTLDSSDFSLLPVVIGFPAAEPLDDEKRLAKCRDVADPALDAEPLRYLEGRILQRRGDYREAAAVFADLRRRDGASPFPLCRLVECLRAAGDEEEANALLEEAVNEAPDDAEGGAGVLSTAAWRLLRRPDLDLTAYHRAFLWTRRTRTLIPASSRALTRVGVAWYRLGLHEKALKTLSLTIQLNRLTQEGKMHPRDISFLAMTYQRLGRPAQARETLLLLRDPERARAWTSSPYVVEAHRVVGLPLEGLHGD